MRALITGSAGSIGTALATRLETVLESDIVLPRAGLIYLDVRDSLDVERVVRAWHPDVIFHLAGAKHAPEGELRPAEIAAVNISGTANVIAAAGRARVVLASSTKAANPETAYGASKLIAERIALNAGHTVCRFYNVRETSGNVFRIWEDLPADEPIPVAPGRRYWITVEQAVTLLLRAAELLPGRYAVAVGEPRWVHDVARELYPERELRAIPLRRGDRAIEPLCAENEYAAAVEPGIVRIYSSHDPA